MIVSDLSNINIYGNISVEQAKDYLNNMLWNCVGKDKVKDFIVEFSLMYPRSVEDEIYMMVKTSRFYIFVYTKDVLGEKA